jgi:hypothetical protein
MWRTLAMVAVLGLILTSDARGADEWSKPMAGIAGKLVAEKVDAKHVRLEVELKNEKSLPLWVTTHSPFSFDLTVKTADGTELKPDAERGDILSSPAPAILPRECRLAMPVTLSQEGRWNLDIVTKLWSLKPGKYRLAGKYITPGDDKEPTLQGKAYTWHGTIELPEIEIEIPAS